MNEFEGIAVLDGDNYEGAATDPFGNLRVGVSAVTIT